MALSFAIVTVRLKVFKISLWQFLKTTRVGLPGPGVFFVFLLYSPISQAFTDTIYFTNIRTFGNSEAIPVSHLHEKWLSPYRQGNFSEGYLTIENGFQRGDYGISLLYRFDIQAHYTPETIDFFYRVKNKRPLQASKTYPLQFTINQHRSTGIRIFLDKTHNDRFQYAAGLSFLRSHFMTHGSMSGNVTSTSTNEYDFNFNVDYSYGDEYLFDRSVSPPVGWGLTPDIRVVYTPISSVKISATLLDLFGFIYWPNAPYTQASANSNIKQYDEDGYQYYQPIMSGRESYQRVLQPINPRFITSLQYNINNVSLLASAMQTTYFTYPKFGLRYRFTMLWASLTRMIKPEIYELSLGNRVFELNVALGSTDIKNLYTGTLNLKLNMRI